jgi:hypothetical protein
MMKYAWAVLRNLIVLGIAIAIFLKADSDYEKIVFSLLVMIYLGIESFRLGVGIASATAFFFVSKELLDIKKLLKETDISDTALTSAFSEEKITKEEKEMNKAWIKFYIETGFISIIFFIALWNLLKGLHII